MSTRAYLVEVPAQLAEVSTFNLWHDETILGFIEDHEDFNDQRDDSGNGTIEVTVKLLKDLLKSKIDLDNEHVLSFKKDIAWAEERGDDYIIYECF